MQWIAKKQPETSTTLIGNLGMKSLRNSEGVKQKFLQNQHLLDELLQTGNKTLVESSYDDVWETGIPLSNRNCLVKEQWKSFGIIGRILMNIRESVNNEDT